MNTSDFTFEFKDLSVKANREKLIEFYKADLPLYEDNRPYLGNQIADNMLNVLIEYGENIFGADNIPDIANDYHREINRTDQTNELGEPLNSMFDLFCAYPIYEELSNRKVDSLSRSLNKTYVMYVKYKGQPYATSILSPNDDSDTIDVSFRSRPPYDASEISPGDDPNTVMRVLYIAYSFAPSVFVSLGYIDNLFFDMVLWGARILSSDLHITTIDWWLHCDCYYDDKNLIENGFVLNREDDIIHTCFDFEIITKVYRGTIPKFRKSARK